MRNLQKYILGLGITCMSLTIMSFVILPKQTTSISTAMNLASAKVEFNFLDFFKEEPEKKPHDNSTLKSTLKGRVQTVSNTTIELVAVSAEHHVQLAWTTPKNHGSRKFIVQRSRDLEKFYDIAEIKPTQNQNMNTFIDESPTGGFINHYRVIEFDSERNMHVYSPMAVEVNAKNGEAFGVTLHTSDEGEIIRIKMENIKESDIFLSTISGMGVPCDTVQKNKNEVVLLPIYPLSPGEYLVKIRDIKDEKRFKVQLKKTDKMF